MNIYFLVEGKRTEKKIYPQWLSYLLPHFSQVNYFDEVVEFNYYLFNSNGYPFLLDDIENAAADIAECGKYSYLVVCLDADEASVQERKNEILDFIDSRSIELPVELVIVVQNRCFETWFLGNRKVFPRNPQDETFREYCRFYSVLDKDPEKMPKFHGYKSIAQFHEDYLKLMLREKGIRYSKKFPGYVGEEHYLKSLQKRTRDFPEHLESLKFFFSFCDDIQRKTI